MGVHVPPRVYKYLTLYTLATGVTKTDVMMELLDNWINKQGSIQSEKELTTSLAERIQSQWLKVKQKKPRAQFGDFRRNIETELVKKGLEESQVHLILLKLKE